MSSNMFLGENAGGSSRESITNLLDEGLGTSLDGTDEISPSTTHSTLGRNDSGEKELLFVSSKHFLIVSVYFHVYWCFYHI